MTSGTTALYTAMAALEIGPGDEVILPAWTWFADYDAIVLCGGVPVFAEIDESFAIDPQDIEARITPRTKAIIACHLQGTPADMDPIMAIAQTQLRVVEIAQWRRGATRASTWARSATWASTASSSARRSRPARARRDHQRRQVFEPPCDSTTGPRPPYTELLWRRPARLRFLQLPHERMDRSDPYAQLQKLETITKNANFRKVRDGVKDVLDCSARRPTWTATSACPCSSIWATAGVARYMKAMAAEGVPPGAGRLGDPAAAS